MRPRLTRRTMLRCARAQPMLDLEAILTLGPLCGPVRPGSRTILCRNCNAYLLILDSTANLACSTGSGRAR